MDEDSEAQVIDALQAFLDAPTWAAAAAVYASHRTELGSDQAIELLTRTARESRLTASGQATVHRHRDVLEWAWADGIETAVLEAEKRFLSKQAPQDAQDHLRQYLAAPDLNSARDQINQNPSLLQLDLQTVHTEARLVGTDEVWRVGLLEAARERGLRTAYQEWAELASIGQSSDARRAVKQLKKLLHRHHGCLRDGTLEILLACHQRSEDRPAQRAVLDDLVDNRSAGSPPGRRAVDLSELGLLGWFQGDVETTRTRYREALTLLEHVPNGSVRALIWLRNGDFHGRSGSDVALGLHSHRAAVEEFMEDGDRVSAAFALELISSLYRSLDRVDQARDYQFLAGKLISELAGDERGLAGDVTTVQHLILKGAAQTHYLLRDHPALLQSVSWLLHECPCPPDETERLLLERLLLASAICRWDWATAEILSAVWSTMGQHDWASIGRFTTRVARVAADDPGAPIGPELSGEFNGMAAVFDRIGSNPAGGARMHASFSSLAVADNLLNAIAGVASAHRLEGTRLMGGHEARVWSTRAQRAAAVLTPTTTVAESGPPPLAPGAAWGEVVARYLELGVWERPDLGLFGPILDHWAMHSRFRGAVRINPSQPRTGQLNVYFFRTDPEGHLVNRIQDCVYLPREELLICSLSYLDDLFGTADFPWDIQALRWQLGLEIEGEGAAEEIAAGLAAAARGQERVLMEWVIAHEIGHAHHRHSAATTAAELAAVEQEADDFFLEGMLADDFLPVLLQSLFTQLDRLYEHDARHQLQRPLTADEKRDRSVVLDSAPGPSGHRPIVFRAVSLIRSILAKEPDLDTTGYIDEFAESLERH